MGAARSVGAFPPLAPVLALALAGGPALADTVVSARPAAVSVVIYREGPARPGGFRRGGTDRSPGVALIVERRDVILPAGRHRIRFEAVADGIIPQSASVEGLPGPIAERDFDFDLLSPGSLLARSVGKVVGLVRTDARTGHEHRVPATLVSGPDGVMIAVDGHVEALGCGGETARLVFDHAPAGLSDKPTLSVMADTPRAGRYRLRVSYLTQRLDWAADYVARINPDGRTLALTGWITLVNQGATGFANAPTEVVAGRLSRVAVTTPEAQARPVERRCWPSQTTHGGWPPPLVLPPQELMNVPSPAIAMPAPPMVMRAMTLTARKMATQSDLGDYKLYTLAEPTTVAARQTKQVLFLDQPRARFSTVYTAASGDAGAGFGQVVPARVALRLDNTKAKGLGAPLPAGTVSLRRPFAGRDLFAGEHPLARDVAVGTPFEIDGGAATDVTVSQRKTFEGDKRQAFEVEAVNAKPMAVTLEIRHDTGGATGFKVLTETEPHALKAGDPVWRLALAAGERRTLAYSVGYDAP